MAKLNLAALLLLVLLGGPLLAAEANKTSSDADKTAADKKPDAAKPADDKPEGEKSASGEGGDEVPEGHSYHGEFLNQGPRQQAYLMGGTGVVRFQVTSKVEEVEKFVQQGIGQLYGFWYLEAERSFRQAAALDPDCAIAYWGAALATIGNEKRSKGFLAEAVKRKDKASEREQMYIAALDAYHKADKAKRDARDAAYRKALEDIALKYPDDLDARAMLCLQLYNARQNGNYLAIEALMQQVLAKEPLHSVHHFRIHLWDYKDAATALTSAARCGQGSPSIAHMWHMPGHIYSRLKRYEDACYQQEASARVDHAHMMRDRVLPDEIHNYAHNNEWLIRNLNFVGRVGDAVDLAKNMVQLPRHPKYNTLSRGSSRYGRQRLFETLTRYELWEEMIQLCDSTYLEATTDTQQQVVRLRHLGIALAQTGNAKRAEEQLKDLQDRLAAETKKRDEAVAKAETKATDDLVKKNKASLDKAEKEAEAAAKKAGDDEEKIKEAKKEALDKAREELIKKNQKTIDKAKQTATTSFATRVRELEQAVSAVSGYLALARKEYKEALPLLRKAGGIDAVELAHVQYLAGETKPAIEAAQKYVAAHKEEAQPNARLVELLWLAEDKEATAKAFEQLRASSSSIDLEAPVFQRLAPIAAELKLPTDWRLANKPADDVGERPSLDTLGPFRWQPSPAPAWQLTDVEGKPHALKDYQGKPHVVIFYLGYGCLHCAEQIQAFAPQMAAFQKAGIEMIAISTDDAEGLKISIDNYKNEKLPIPLVSDEKMEVFKRWRVYDDFEQQPLHGTFLVDGAGMILWQDISYEPFKDPKFLLEEAQRLLGQQ